MTATTTEHTPNGAMLALHNPQPATLVVDGARSIHWPPAAADVPLPVTLTLPAVNDTPHAEALARGAARERERLATMAESIPAIDAATNALINAQADPRTSPWEAVQAAVRAFLELAAPTEQHPERITSYPDRGPRITPACPSLSPTAGKPCVLADTRAAHTEHLHQAATTPGEPQPVRWMSTREDLARWDAQ